MPSSAKPIEDQAGKETINKSVGCESLAEPVKKTISNKGRLDDIAKEDHENELIKSGYRIGYTTYKEIFLSMFSLHNETTNVWSHFLGLILFLVVLIVILIIYPNIDSMGIAGSFNKYNEQRTLNSSLTVYEFVNDEANHLVSSIKAADQDMETNMHLESDPLISSDAKLESERRVESKIQNLASAVERLAYLVVTHVFNYFSMLQSNKTSDNTNSGTIF